MDRLSEPQAGAAMWLERTEPTRGMPPEAPVAMPAQSLHSFDAGTRRPLRGRSPIWRRVVVLGGALAVTLTAVWFIAEALAVEGITPLEAIVLVLFALNVAWIALTFVSALVGTVVLVAHRGSRASPPLPAGVRTAVLMPVYNEDPQRVFAAIEAMARGVGEIAPAGQFDWFVLSDTTAPHAAVAEEVAFVALRARIGEQARVYYRRRSRNTARKSGNLADFCRRWGGAYDFLVVLDADSLMEPATIVTLAARMAADPDAGLIQTIPRLIRGRTLLARLHQFAGRIYGPVLTTGLAWWVGNEGNYWGHNAIIRREAFATAAGLPVLSGSGPFGGQILSHDFVEAALLRRAGWSVKIADDLHGTYEETPPSLSDFAVRDRRWCQGNLQHTRVVRARGLHWVSRFHLLSGIFSYLFSALWVLLIAAGLAMAVQAGFTPTDYFPDPLQIFPKWPRLDSALELQTLALTALVLLAPKLLGLFVVLVRRDEREAHGGGLRVVVGCICETLLSTLIAPVVMVMQTGAIVSIILGQDSGWHAQQRKASGGGLRAVWRRYGRYSMMGAGLTALAWWVSPSMLIFLAPVAAGLTLAPLVAGITGSAGAGRVVRRAGLLLTPEEMSPPPIERAMLATLLAYRTAPTPELDVLRVMRDVSRRRHHLAIIDAGERRTPGEVDTVVAVVTAKVGQATSLEQALAFLRPEEQAVALGTPALFERLSVLGRLEESAA